MKHHIIFLDFDGTLTDEYGAVPASALQAIRESRKKGNKVFLCTGRCPAELYDWILDIGFDGIIAAGGAYVKIGEAVIRDLHFKEADLHYILDVFDELNMDYIMESNHGLYGSKHAFDRLQQLLPAHEQLLLDVIVFDENVRDLKDISKLVFLDSGISIAAIKKQFGSHYQVTPTTVPIFGKESGELALKDIHKANAIAQVLQYLDYDITASYAYGDGANDMEMIRYVHTGIAMSNGNPALLKIADDIAEPAGEDGLYYSFMKHGLL